MLEKNHQFCHLYHKLYPGPRGFLSPQREYQVTDKVFWHHTGYTNCSVTSVDFTNISRQVSSGPGARFLPEANCHVQTRKLAEVRNQGPIQ